MNKILLVGRDERIWRYGRIMREILPEAKFGWCDLGGYTAKPAFAVDKKFAIFGEAIKWHADAAIIATAPSENVGLAAALLEDNIHVLLEMPLAPNSDRARELLAFWQKSKAVLMPAYHLRFHPSVQWIFDCINRGIIGTLARINFECGQYLPTRAREIYGSEYQDSQMAHRDLGGGALLDFSKLIDAALWFCGEAVAVSAVLGRSADYKISVEDFASVLLRHQRGSATCINVDFLQQPGGHRWHFLGSKGSILWQSAKPERIAIKQLDTEPKVQIIDAALDHNASKRIMLEHFIACAKGKKELDYQLSDALRVLQVVETARENARKH